MFKIKSLLNENGIVYIGIKDKLYKTDENGGSVIELLYRNFVNVRILDNKSRYQWILEASKKKNSEERNETNRIKAAATASLNWAPSDTFHSIPKLIKIYSDSIYNRYYKND
tara:strand:- start:8631 stop:8966 length:336 start_codon:yes stop_codon:yes gene_type:complete